MQISLALQHVFFLKFEFSYWLTGFLKTCFFQKCWIEKALSEKKKDKLFATGFNT